MYSDDYQSFIPRGQNGKRMDALNNRKMEENTFECVMPMDELLPRYSHIRSNYLSKISQIVKSDVTVFPDDHLTDLLLYGSESFNRISNDLILNETINFIFKSERFKILEAYSQS